MRKRAWIVVGIALLLRPGGITFAQAQDDSAKSAAAQSKLEAAQRTLQAAGLTQSGKFWITANEVEFRRQLQQVPREEKTFYTAQQQFRTLLGQFQATRGELQKYRTRLTEVRDLLGKNSSSSLERQQLETESQQVAEQISQAEQVISGRLNVLDESSEMTIATVDLVNAQNGLAIQLLNLKRRLSAMTGDYQRLAKDDQIQKALAVLRSDALGPVENYGALPRRLERLESIVFTDGVPFYRRSGQIRITAILDERLPFTFSYTGATGPTVLPASALANVAVDLAGAPPGEPVLVEQESIPTRRVKLPQLRIGKFVWQQVTVDVLPPEADYLGGRISQQAFAMQQASIEEGKLWFRLREPQ